MKSLIATAASVFVLASAALHADDGAQTITVTRVGSQPSNKGPAQFFTGSVRVDPLFAANAPSRTSGGLVTFEPGARSAWHTHPVGQILIVTAGKGLVQRWGSPVEEIRPGDVVRIPPGVKHWDEPHCHPRSSRRQERGLDGASERRAIREMKKGTEYETSKRSHCLAFLDSPLLRAD